MNVEVFGWVIRLEGFGDKSQQIVLEGRKLFQNDQARQKFIKEFGAHCEAIGFHLWQSYTYTLTEEVLA